jgi:hypothetical protein
MGILTSPGCLKSRPTVFWYIEPGQQLLADDYLRYQRESHLMQLLGGRLQILFYLPQAKTVAGALVPVGLAIEGMKLEAKICGPLTPVRTLGQGNALHV